MKQSGRPKKPEAEKRNSDLTVSYNRGEIEILKSRSELAKQKLAHFVRDMSLRDEMIQIVSMSDREAAREIRGLQDLFNKLYISQRKKLRVANVEKQTDSNYTDENHIGSDDHLWGQINDLLRQLNARFLGYADHHSC